MLDGLHGLSIPALHQAIGGQTGVGFLNQIFAIVEEIDVFLQSGQRSFVNGEAELFSGDFLRRALIWLEEESSRFSAI